MGELGRLVYTFYSAPLWFFEGDAVGIETALTDGGRGRQPAFDMDIRALLVSGERYSYDKAYFGSYRDWFPSIYPLGYLLTTHVKRKYGPEAWSRVLDRLSKNSWITLSFSGALKEIGKGVKGLYENTMDELEAGWKGQLKNLNLTDFRALNSMPRHVWTNYTFPCCDTDGTIYVQKFGLADPLHLVRIGLEGREEKVTQFAPLQYFFNRLSVEKGRAVWNEYVPDPRWGKRSFSDLFIFDLKNGKKKRVTHKARLFDPVLSPDGKNIAAVEFTVDYRCALVILSAETGRETMRMPNQDEDLIFLPAWSEDSRRIVMVRQNKQGRALSILDVQTGERRDIIPPGLESMDYPVFYRDYILYHSPCSGIDNIYAVHVPSRQRFQVTSSRFGAFFPEVSPDGERLLYCDYSVEGYDAAEAPLDPSAWKRFEDIGDRSLHYWEPLVSQEQGGNIFEGKGVPDIEHEVKNYHPSAHLFNVHSWIPLASPPELSLFFISSDKLSKSSMMAGVKYHVDEKVAGFEWNGSYAGLFPVLDFGVGTGGRSSTYMDENNEQVAYGWRESSARLGFHIPLDLSRGSTRCLGGLFAQPMQNANGRLLSLKYFFNYIRLREPSIRDLYPTWGQAFDLSFYHTPFKGDYRGASFSAKIGLYLPGLLKHHSLRMHGGYERQEPDNYRFPNDVLFPRGYDYRFFGTVLKASVDYALPLAYPDLALGSLLYLKRFKINVFYDYGVGRSGTYSENYQSVGIDFLADFHLFRLPLEIETGPRLVYRLKDKSTRLEWLIFGINL
jgi:hypothetical protein